jgi:hypothetical protein
MSLMDALGAAFVLWWLVAGLSAWIAPDSGFVRRLVASVRYRYFWMPADEADALALGTLKVSVVFLALAAFGAGLFSTLTTISSHSSFATHSGVIALLSFGVCAAAITGCWWGAKRQAS